LGGSFRVGVVLTDAAVAAWQHRLLCQFAFDERAELSLVVRVSGAPAPATRGLALRLYRALDRRLFGSPHDPLAPIDATEVLARAPAVDVRAVPSAEGFALDAADVERLRAENLDALLQLGGGRLAGDVLGAARHGLWTFAHEEQARRGHAPFFAEMRDGAPVVAIRLVARRPDGERILVRSFASASPNSLAHNLEPACWRASDLPARAWRGYTDGREPPFDGGADDDPAEAPRSRAPGPFEVARVVVATTARVARNRSRLRRHDRVWFVALRPRGEAPLASDPLRGFTPLPCPADRFHADPMLVESDGAHHLFFEDADRASGIGAISYRAIAADGSAAPIHRILEADTHFSYPFVFRWQGSWYLIPETTERRTVELHRAVEFPLRWQLEKVLFHDVVAADTTVFEDRGRLWLFTAMSPSGGSTNDELHLFHAETPTSEWVPHPMNPIVSDVRRARPAGPLVRDGGVLYRPGQDCAGDYGAAFWLNRVEVLDERTYRETPVRRIDASWHPGGLCTHTYTRAGRFEAMDNRIWLPR